METPRTAEEIVGDLKVLAPDSIGAAVLALPDDERTTLARAVLPTRDEHQVYVETFADDPDLGTM